MPFRLYLTPAVGAGTRDDPRRPKYFDGKTWAGMDYGFQPRFLVAANLSAADELSLVAQADVFAFPVDLSATLGAGQATSARDALELALVPAQWVNATMTWRSVARAVAGMFQFMQRLNGILGNEVVITDAAQLNGQWSSVPANYQAAILSTAQSFGYDTGFIQGNTQLRAILKTFADGWGDQPFRLGLFTF